jgi:hypothetical protein
MLTMRGAGGAAGRALEHGCPRPAVLRRRAGPAVGIGVGAGQRRQTGQPRQVSAAVVVARDSDADAQERAAGRQPVATGEAGDGRRVDAEHLEVPRHVLAVRIRREAEADLIDRASADREVVAVEQTLAHQDVHHRQGQRAIAAGPHHQVLVGLLGGGRAVRIDDDEVRAPGPRLLDQRHDVDRGVGRVDPPQHHQVGAHHLLGVVAGDRAERGPPPCVGGGHADRAIELAGAQGVEERVARGTAVRHGARRGERRIASALSAAIVSAPPVGDLPTASRQPTGSERPCLGTTRRSGGQSATASARARRTHGPCRRSRPA